MRTQMAYLLTVCGFSVFCSKAVIKHVVSTACLYSPHSPGVCRYCAGTMPWGNTGDHRAFEPQRHDDGCIEVIGFTMASLVSASALSVSQRMKWTAHDSHVFPVFTSRRRCRWAVTASGCISAERWSSPPSRRCRCRWTESRAASHPPPSAYL